MFLTTLLYVRKELGLSLHVDVRMIARGTRVLRRTLPTQQGFGAKKALHTRDLTPFVFGLAAYFSCAGNYLGKLD